MPKHTLMPAILAALARDGGGMRQATLARLLGKDPYAIRVSLAALLAKGLVVKEGHAYRLAPTVEEPEGAV